MRAKAISGIMLTLFLTSMLALTFNIKSVSSGVYPTVYLEPAITVDSALTTGNNYTVSIKTDYNGNDIQSYQFTLSYNPSILHGVKITNGDLITTDKHPMAQFMLGTFDNTTGSLSLTGAFFFFIFPPAPLTSGPGTLANVTFTVVGTGCSNITLGPKTKLIGYSGDGYGDPYDVINGTMTGHIQHGFFNNVKPFHDVAVTSVVAPTTMVVIGQLVSNINVIVANEGNSTETFDVIAYANTIVIGTQTSVTLTSGTRTTLTFNWDTTDAAEGNCTITAEAVLASDADLANNHATTTVSVAPGALNPVSPGHYETSEFLIGSVAVGVILPESNGTIDPSTENWTSIEESQVVSEIRAGLDWWAAYNLSAGVSFSVEVHYRVPTSYEPISCPVWDNWLWISEVMTYLGYPGTYYDYHTQVLDYINDLRNRLGTNWAFAIFVADSSNDYDGRFEDGGYAYASLGGPSFVMTYDNYRYGINNMDYVTAHEMGHTFYATDEYDDRREYSGYLNASDNDGAICLMNQKVWKLCDATQEQIGWRDTDGDGILDIVDTVPDTTLNPYHPDPTSNSTLTYTGSVTVAAYPNRKPFWWGECKNITINTITNVEYRIDNGPWMNATPTDGAFDEAQENFTCTTPSLSGGVHRIEVRGTNSVGNVETSYASDIVTVTTPTVTATVNIHPYTLNLRSMGLWITVYIELREGYNVEDINVSTILLNDRATAESSKVSGKKLKVRFDRSKVIALLPQEGEVELTITGTLLDGASFEGSDSTRVVFPSMGMRRCRGYKR